MILPLRGTKVKRPTDAMLALQASQPLGPLLLFIMNILLFIVKILLLFFILHNNL